MVTRIGKGARTDQLVATMDHCFGVPGHSGVGERHSLEVQPWYLWRPLGLGKFAWLSTLTELRFLAGAKSSVLFPLR